MRKAAVRRNFKSSVQGRSTTSVGQAARIQIWDILNRKSARRVSPVEAVLERLLQRALAGDHRSAATVIELAERYGGVVPKEETPSPQYDFDRLSDEELETLQALLAAAKPLFDKCRREVTSAG